MTAIFFHVWYAVWLKIDDDFQIAILNASLPTPSLSAMTDGEVIVQNVISIPDPFRRWIEGREIDRSRARGMHIYDAFSGLVHVNKLVITQS